jgi:hypothetical protein
LFHAWQQWSTTLSYDRKIRFESQFSLNLLLGTITDGITAFLTLFAMACGLIVPKLCMECVWSKTISADHCDAPRPLNGTDSDTK